MYLKKRYNACITRLLPCRLSLNLPLNTVNSKKPRMPNVANRVDAIVMCVFISQIFPSQRDRRNTKNRLSSRYYVML